MMKSMMISHETKKPKLMDPAVAFEMRTKMNDFIANKNDVSHKNCKPSGIGGKKD